MRAGYVLKVFPRLSETFILNELLAHERAGANIGIFSLRAPTEDVVHESVADVRARVEYLPTTRLTVQDLWTQLGEASSELPGFDAALAGARGEEVRDAYQAVVLARAARARGLTHLHAHFGSAATTVARLAARFAGLPYSFTAHAKDIFHESVRADDLQRKLTDAAAVITVSDFNLAYLRELCPSVADRLHRVYNGLDLEAYPYAAPTARPARIVAVGRLVEKKGFGHLIEACALLAGRGRDFRCDIAGAGLLEPELRAAIDRHRLGDRVRLLGARTQAQVRELVAGAAVLAAPCVVAADGNRDGLPTVLVEAMALGTPCVATDTTGIPELVRDGATGLLVGQRDPGALAAALEALLDGPELRVRLAGAGRELVESEFDIHVNTARIRELLAPAGHDRPQEEIGAHRLSGG